VYLLNVSEISETLFDNSFFGLIELGGIVVGEFPQKKGNERFQILEASGHPLFGFGA
jgi:hypothetical protein